MKKKLFDVNARDCTWQTFKGSGSGGQNRNKNSTAVRCTHRGSGAVGVASEHKSQKQNKRAAFKRMAESKEFKRWVKIECSKLLGHQTVAERYAEQEITSDRIKVEVKIDGKWVEFKYAFCEPVHAIAGGAWHMRKLTEIGPKFGGGADTQSLCGRDMGWDLEVIVTDFHIDNNTCKKCAEAYKKLLTN